MAAPKVAGCFFGGDLQGEPKPGGRLPGRMLGFSEMELARQTKQNPARRRARLASLSWCLREHAGHTEIYRPASTRRF